MASTYLDLLTKMQEQGLEALKQTQSAYLESLAAARKVVEAMPMPVPMPQMPVIEGVPTLAELTDLNVAFIDKVVEQQKAYAKQLADVFAPVVKSA
jgi:hypothetical protein